MCQYFLYSLQGTYPVIGVLGEEPANEWFDVLGDTGGFGELGFRVENGEEYVLLLRGVEGWSAEEEFVEEDSQGVEVHLIGMSGPGLGNNYLASISGAMYSGLPQ